MKRQLVAAVLVAGLALAYACGSDNKGTTEPPPPPPPPPSDTGDTAATPPDTVQLQDGVTIGQPTFADGNTSEGGQGDPVNGIACDGGMTLAYHIHVHLSLYVNGEQLAIPKAVGVMNPFIEDNIVVAATCYYWVHTHDETGIVHVEPSSDVQVTLGDLFDIWGEPLSETGVAGYDGDVTVYVDGEKYTDDPRGIVFEDHKQIAIEVGTPLVTPDYYLYPQGY